MTKEELEKEASTYAKKHRMLSYCGPADVYVSDEKEIIKAILYFAEPREKRISDLEKENAKLKCFIRDLIHENRNLCFQFGNTTCLFNSDYRNRAEEFIGEKL